MSADAAPLFILSFRHRDELTRLAEAAGWRPIAARRSLHAEARFASSGAAVAIVDARGALSDGKEAVRRLADVCETNAAALLVFVSRTDGDALDEMGALGASQFLMSPMTEAQLIDAIRFAERHAERLSAKLGRSRRAAGDASTSWRLEAGARSIELSPALARKAGLGEDDGRRISLMEMFRKLDGDGRKAARAAVDRVRATGETTAFAHGDPGGERLAHHVRSGADGSIVAQTETISGWRDDILTGVRDAAAVRQWIDARAGGAVTLLLLGVSRFDAINAAFGRAVGDSVLQAAARRIEQLVAPRDGVVGRVAGAEFAIATCDDDGAGLAERLDEAIARPFMSGEHLVTLGARIGVARLGPGDDAAALMRRASVALARTRNGGRAVGAAGERLEIDLRRAFDRDEIDILFQPQVSMTSGAIVGVEALARWRHQEHGELGAATLFDVAERSDYLTQLSDHVQRKAIAEAAAWPKALAALRVAINITAEDIGRPGFASQLLDAITVSGLDPRRLTVEVTESSLIDDLAAAAILLARLREDGLRVAIDDFGTGYSSLAYLKALPLDYLKIDKELSDDICGSSRDRIVVRGVIEMARSLGLAVIAEGVESEGQMDLLAREGCNFYQGFLCSPPISSERLIALIDSRA